MLCREGAEVDIKRWATLKDGRWEKPKVKAFRGNVMRVRFSARLKNGKRRLTILFGKKVKNGAPGEI